MKQRQTSSRRVRLLSWSIGIALCGVLLLGLVLTAAAQVRSEIATALRASEILPPDLLSGTNFRVDERVLNDGYLNHYKIYSKYGEFAAVSTAMLRKRIHEINAMADLEKVKGTKEFMSSFKESGFKTLEGAKSLITRPVKTVYGTVAGVGKVFQGAKDSLFGHKRSKSEESRLKDVIGFSKVKREYAYQFGVDVYSRNEPLQERLGQISWAGYAGGLSMSAALAPISGGVSVAISVSRLSRLFNEIFRTTPPNELRRMNQKKLVDMGISKDLADLYIDNQAYTPREQTLIVAALGEMKGVRGRSAFVKFAVPTDNADMAFFRERQAEMYAGYHETVEPIKEFVPLGRFVAAHTGGGKLIFNVPLDHLVWTDTMAGFVGAASSRVDALRGVTSKELWVTGTVSPLAREELKKGSWKIQERTEARLLEMTKENPSYKKKGKNP